MKNLSARRLKLILIVVVLGASALALFAWTQVWVHADVGLSGSATQQLQITGSTAAPAVSALALAGFALAGALTIAGRVIRIVLGGLEVLLGVSVFLSAIIAVSDPAQASAPAVTAATGIAGHESIQVSVVGALVTAWPYVAMVAAVIMALAGVTIIVTSGRWPGPTKRFQAVRFDTVEDGSGTASAAGNTGSAAATEAGTDSVGDWDDLSRGQDPTSR